VTSAVFVTGFNVSEGVTFAPADWLRFLDASAARHRRFRQPSPVNHELLLLQVRGHGEVGSTTAQLCAGCQTSHCQDALVLVLIAIGNGLTPFQALEPLTTGIGA
jgi:hypothetical protein